MCVVLQAARMLWRRSVRMSAARQGAPATRQKESNKSPWLNAESPVICVFVDGVLLITGAWISRRRPGIGGIRQGVS